MKQLDLLTWTPPKTLLVFPLARRTDRVRRVAEVLTTKRGNAALHYWKTTVAALAGQMERTGVERSVIDHELRQFHDAVQRELYRVGGGHGQRPGGSARMSNVVEFPQRSTPHGERRRYPYRIEARGHELYIVREADDRYWRIGTLVDDVSRDLLFSYMAENRTGLDQAFARWTMHRETL